MCSIFWRIFFLNPLACRELVSLFPFLSFFHSWMSQPVHAYLCSKLAKTKWAKKYVIATIEKHDYPSSIVTLLLSVYSLLLTLFQCRLKSFLFLPHLEKTKGSMCNLSPLETTRQDSCILGFC